MSFPDETRPERRIMIHARLSQPRADQSRDGNAPLAGCTDGYAYAKLHDILRLILFLGFAG